MGWGRMLLLGNVGQQMDLSELRDELERLTTRIGVERTLREGADGMIGRLRAENNELKLYLAAMVRLLLAKQLVTTAEIREIVDVLDREDDKADGVFGGTVMPD